MAALSSVRRHAERFSCLSTPPSFLWLSVRAMATAPKGKSGSTGGGSSAGKVAKIASRGGETQSQEILDERKKEKEIAAEAAAIAADAALKSKTMDEISEKMKGKNLLQFLQQEAVLDMGMSSRLKYLDRKHPDCLRPGYAVEVQTVSTKSKRRHYDYLGTIIAIRRNGLSSSFVVRNTLDDEGFEMRFPFFSPMIVNIRILNKDLKVRRAKLYYMKRDETKDIIINHATLAMEIKKQQATKSKAKALAKALPPPAAPASPQQLPA